MDHTRSPICSTKTYNNNNNNSNNNCKRLERFSIDTISSSFIALGHLFLSFTCLVIVLFIYIEYMVALIYIAARVYYTRIKGPNIMDREYAYVCVYVCLLMGITFRMEDTGQ